MVDNKKTMAVVNIPYKYNEVLLNSDDAYALFKILCNAEPVSYDYNIKSYKRNDDHADRPIMKSFTVVDYASLALNSEPK
jgi:hypothetical protein